MYSLSIIFMWFILYSFIGWLYESIVLSIEHKKIINTGFLSLPLCPIYGFGALICLKLLFMHEKTDIVLLFLGSGVLCCILEYFVSWFMEKLFDTRWWDYSNYKFNLNGRVCLWGFLAFGILCVFLLKHIHPLIKFIVNVVPENILCVICVVIFIVIILDIISTLKTIHGLNEKLADVQKTFDVEKEKSKQRLEGIKQSFQDKASDFKDKIDEYTVEIKIKKPTLSNIYLYNKIKELFTKRKFSEERILRAFPNVKSIRYKDALENIKKFRRKNTNTEEDSKIIVDIEQ